MIKVKKVQKQNLNKIAKIASENFSGLKKISDARKWVKANFLAFPRTQYFAALKGNEICGYILWLEKGGFRKESIFELEQIAVAKGFQGQGVGTQLIEKSLPTIKKYLKKRGSVLKAIEVTTGTENQAQNLYKKTLAAEPECVVKNLFQGDEIIMIARFI